MSSKSLLERGPPKKRKKDESHTNSICFLCKKLCDEKHEYTETQWNAFKLTSKQWDGLDKYGNVYRETDWLKGTKDDQTVFHRSCTKYMQSKSTLNQALKRKDKGHSSHTEASSSRDTTDIVDRVITQQSIETSTSSINKK